MSSPPSKTMLSTSSAEGIQVASQITSTRLANLLIRHGPMPIRHITAQLSIEVPGFELLSLSKQRRLIMAAMELKDETNDVVFEKIGWGQWAVRHDGSDYIVTEGTETAAAGSGMPEKSMLSVQDLRSQTGLKLGWTKKQSNRRESITNTKSNLHNVKVPSETISASSAIESDSEDEPMDEADDESDSSSESDNELFVLDNDFGTKKRSPPIKFADRVPLKVMSPPPGTANRRKSSSAANPNSVHKHRHAIFNRSRLNSIENLDNYILSSGKNSTHSFNSPPPLSASPINSLGLSIAHHTMNTSPESIEAAFSAAGRRKSSFNESHLRSTLSSSVPMSLHTPETVRKPYQNRSLANSATRLQPVSNPVNSGEQSDTDEEDWATIGAESLRKPNGSAKNTVSETLAATALVDLMSV